MEDGGERKRGPWSFNEGRTLYYRGWEETSDQNQLVLDVEERGVQIFDFFAEIINE